jgi:hypothetical protein
MACYGDSFTLTDDLTFNLVHKQVTKINLKLNLKLICDRQSVGQSILVSGAYLEPATNFSFSSKFLLDSCGFIIF